MTTARQRWHRAELSYCSNVHAVASLNDFEQVLDAFYAPMREQRQLDRQHAGLWLPASVIEQAEPAELIDRLGARLEQHHLFWYTANAFPIGRFHGAKVKARVYQPDWQSDDRRDYTLAIAELMAAAAPSSQWRTLSTVPLGFGADWTADAALASRRALVATCLRLSELEARTGNPLMLCLEMEPDCALEYTPQALEWFDQFHSELSGDALAAVQRHLGLCFDICHQAVEFEDVGHSLRQLHSAGIAIGKIQVSSALRVLPPLTGSVRNILNTFAASPYFHQTRLAPLSGGRAIGWNDLVIALAEPALRGDREMRVHYHVPLQHDTLLHEQLRTTNDMIEPALAFLAAHPTLHPDLEIETYTWNALPAGLRPHDDASLRAGLLGEIEWLETRLRAHDLLEG